MKNDVLYFKLIKYAYFTLIIIFKIPIEMVYFIGSKKNKTISEEIERKSVGSQTKHTSTDDSLSRRQTLNCRINNKWKVQKYLKLIALIKIFF